MAGDLDRSLAEQQLSRARPWPAHGRPSDPTYRASSRVPSLCLREFEDSWSNSADNLVRLGAMDFAELLERAHHYRMMAIRVTDDQTREGLLELAEQYE